MAAEDRTGGRGDYITVVSGLPRSGTSMMMRMLEAGGMPVLTDNLRQADADNPRGYYEYERIKQLKTDSSWLKDIQGMAVKMVYRLLYELPETHKYRVLFMKRNLEEVVASQEVMLERNHKPTSTLSAEQLAAAFQAELERLQRWLSNRSNFRVLSLEYRQVLGQPEVTAVE